MNLMKIAVVGFVLMLMAGCIGEDYDVGVPEAELNVRNLPKNIEVSMIEANVQWDSSTGNVEKDVDDVDAFGRSQEAVEVVPGQSATIGFKENPENGGDIWTDPTLSYAIWKDGDRHAFDTDESIEFEFDFPEEEGTYVLEAIFDQGDNVAQYVAKVVVRSAK